MLKNCDYKIVRDVLLEKAAPVDTEEVPLQDCAGRVLAREILAQSDIPPFDRSPYDGYAFRAEDTAQASEEQPVTLRITDYIAAGDVPHCPVTAGTAAHLMTGAPVPEGADAVLPFEKTRFTEETVTISEPQKSGSNIVYAGEDVQKGQLLCPAGIRIDAGLAGTLAGQRILRPLVYRKPVVAILSTGTELLEEDEDPSPGRISNTNRYTLQAACTLAGCTAFYAGTARDDEDEISRLLTKAMESCDAVIISGGVSVGDYDCTPAAMEKAGIRLLARGLSLKPGMAGAYGICEKEGNGSGGSGGKGIPVFGLSGNPAACMTAFYAVVLPVLKKRTGLRQYLPEHVRVRLTEDYSRRNQSARLLRGRIDPGGTVQEMQISPRQGNQMLASFAESNAFAEIPAGASLEAGDIADAFLF